LAKFIDVNEQSEWIKVMEKGRLAY